LHICFASSLEVQDKLVKTGYKVLRDKSGKIRTPIPIIYSNFRSWIATPEPITIERLIPPEWYDKSPDELGWKETEREGKSVKGDFRPKTTSRNISIRVFYFLFSVIMYNL